MRGRSGARIAPRPAPTAVRLDTTLQFMPSLGTVGRGLRSLSERMWKRIGVTLRRVLRRDANRAAIAATVRLLATVAAEPHPTADAAREDGRAR